MVNTVPWLLLRVLDITGLESMVQPQPNPVPGLLVHLIVVTDPLQPPLHIPVELHAFLREDDMVECLGAHLTCDVVDVCILERWALLDQHKGRLCVGVDDVVVLGVVGVGMDHLDDAGKGLLIGARPMHEPLDNLLGDVGEVLVAETVDVDGVVDGIVAVGVGVVVDNR